MDLPTGTAVQVECVAENSIGTSAKRISLGDITPIEKPPKLVISGVVAESDLTQPAVDYPEEAAAAGLGKLKISTSNAPTDSKFGAINCYQCQAYDASNDVGITSTPPALSCPNGVCDACVASNGIQSTLEAGKTMPLTDLAINSQYYFKCRARNQLGWG